MTRREFDRATRQNWGGRMASDERQAYRRERLLPAFGCPALAPCLAGWTRDYIAERAAQVAALRGARYAHESILATLGRGSQYRAPQAYRAASGKPLLFGR